MRARRLQGQGVARVHAASVPRANTGANHLPPSSHCHAHCRAHTSAAIAAAAIASLTVGPHHCHAQPRAQPRADHLCAKQTIVTIVVIVVTVRGGVGGRGEDDMGVSSKSGTGTHTGSSGTAMAVASIVVCCVVCCDGTPPAAHPGRDSSRPVLVYRHAGCGRHRFIVP
jgi:hypothetical protein